MKKLPIFEHINYQEYPLVDTIPVKTKRGEGLATWTWSEDFDRRSCHIFFDMHRDIIMNLNIPYTSHDEAARLFILGCSYGYALSNTPKDLEPDILRIIPK